MESCGVAVCGAAVRECRRGDGKVTLADCEHFAMGCDPQGVIRRLLDSVDSRIERDAMTGGAIPANQPACGSTEKESCGSAWKECGQPPERLLAEFGDLCRNELKAVEADEPVAGSQP